MKNLYELNSLTNREIMEILDQAKKFKLGKKCDLLKGKKIINIFFEPSTRTHYSFITAEQNLQMEVTNFNVESSSIKKGESLYDTLKTFEMIGFDAAVLRHPAKNYFKILAGVKIPILSGGDGTGSHPTQSLLDLYTIREEFGEFTGLKIAIVGDIRHSRVAHTNIKVMKKLGMEVYISGPKDFDDNSSEYIEFERVVREMDIIMLLRVQYERHGYSMVFDQKEYNDKYGLNSEKLKLMKKNAIIMHPGPFNRGTELTDEVVECKKSRILQQMTNGVFVRMACLKRSFTEGE